MSLRIPKLPSIRSRPGLERVASRTARSYELGEEGAETLPWVDSTVVASFLPRYRTRDEKGTGQNKINQDCACVCYPYCGDPQCALFCVFDGHGHNGTAISSALLEWCVRELETSCMQ